MSRQTQQQQRPSTSQAIPVTPSPPKPVPALHGSLALPYARNPSGTDSIMNEPSAPYLSQIWGIKSKVIQLDPGGSGSTYRACDPISTDKNHQAAAAARGKKDHEGLKAKENIRGGGWEAELRGPLASGSGLGSGPGGKRKSGGKKVVIMDDSDQVIGRRKGGSGEGVGVGGVGMPLRGETRGQQHGLRQSRTGDIRASEPGPSGSNWTTKPSGSTFLSTSTSEPVLAALAFQAKLLSPEKPKPRQSLSPHRSPGSDSPTAAHVIDGYGPPQPPTVSPISAERKAAMLVAEKRRREQGGGGGGGGGRSPGKSPSGKSWGQEASPGRSMLTRADGGEVRALPARARKEIEQVSPSRPEKSKSWPERMAIQAEKQQKLIERLPSTGGSAQVQEAKMRYSPAHGQWIAVAKPTATTQDKGVQQDRVRPKIPPLEFVDSNKNPFLDPPATLSQPGSASPEINIDEIVQRPKSPYDFSHLKGSLDQIKAGQHAGLGLGRPGFPPSAGSVFGGGGAVSSSESIWASLKRSNEGGAAIKALSTDPSATVNRAVSTPISTDKPCHTDATAIESVTVDGQPQHDGRRVVSESSLATKPEAVTSGFASFMSNSRIVSDPLPASKGKKWPKRRKGAKQPVVEDWSALKQKFVAGETTRDFQKVDKAVRQVADVFTKTLPKPDTAKTNNEKMKDGTAGSSAHVDQSGTSEFIKRETQRPLHQTLQSRIPPVATHKENDTTAIQRERDARYANPRDYSDKRRNNDAQQYRGRIRSDKPRIRSSWTPARERMQNNNNNDQTYSVTTTGHALPKPKPE